VFDCALLTLYFSSEKYWKSFSLMELMGNNESIAWETVDSVSSTQIIVESFKSVFVHKMSVLFFFFFLLKVTLKTNLWRLPYTLDYSESQWRKKTKIPTVRDKQWEWLEKVARCSQFCGLQVSWCRVFKSALVKWELWVLETLMGL